MSSFGGDPKLVPRLKLYMLNYPNESYYDPSEVAIDLQQKYTEYERKKFRPFVRLVSDVLQTLGVNGGEEEKEVVVEEEKKEEKMNRKERRKRKSTPSSTPSQRAQEVVVSSDEDADKDKDKYVEYPDTNLANLSLTKLYSGNNGTSTVPSAATKQSSSTPSSSANKKQKKTGTSSAVSANNLNKPRGLAGANSFTLEPRKSEVRFEQLGGCDKQFLEVCRLAMHMRRPKTYEMLGIEPPKGFLVHGPPGCGKTMFAQAVAGEFDLPLLQLAATELVSGVSGETEDKIRQLFEIAKTNAPCVLVLDDIDSIAPRRETATREMERRVVTQLSNSLDELFTPQKEKNLEDKIEFMDTGDIVIHGEKVNNHPLILVIGTTSRPDALDGGLRRAGRFDCEISLGIPDEDAREKILNTICKLPIDSSVRMRMVARLTPGYVGADLNSLVREAGKCAVNRIFDTMAQRDPHQKHMTNEQVKEELEKVLAWLQSEDDPSTIESLGGFHVTMQDFERALENVQPSAKREGFATVPDVSWQDIGALKDIRNELEWNILYPVKRPEDFALLGISSKPQGILLCGPPGCGKTLLAKAVANETGMNFISVKGPELLNMYVGESERAVRTVFQRARDSSPCVIFFDEIDALCPKRSHNETSGGARLVNQLLTEMDGVEARKLVFLIGATNRPDIVDSAILRPGRLDKILFVDFPNEEDRADILRKSTKNGTRPLLGSSVCLHSLAAHPSLDGFTGADLAALVHEAAIIALKQRLFNDDKTIEAVEMCHFEAAIAKIRPSVTEADRKRYMKMKEVYGTGGGTVARAATTQQSVEQKPV